MPISPHLLGTLFSFIGALVLGLVLDRMVVPGLLLDRVVVPGLLLEGAVVPRLLLDRVVVPGFCVEFTLLPEEYVVLGFGSLFVVVVVFELDLVLLLCLKLFTN